MVPSPGHLCEDVTFERIELDGQSWVEVARGVLADADAVFAALRDGVRWRQDRLFRYEKYEDERRLGAQWRRGRPLPHPALGEVHRLLQRRWKVHLDGFSMIQYRDGRDGQGFHRDTDMRWLDDTAIAVLSLGATRPWLLRPRAHRGRETRGATHDLRPAAGDLLIMGGRCQADWEHAVPYLGTRPVGVRISLQWRHARKVGEPYRGASFRADVRYGMR